MSVMTEEEMDYQIELLEELCNNESDSAENLYEFTESELSAHDAQIRADERAKVIDEFLEKVLHDNCEGKCPSTTMYCYKCVAMRVAEQMKGQK